jgi:hypothetical protein
VSLSGLKIRVSVVRYKIIRRLESNVFPWLGQRPIRDIKPVDLLAVIQRIEQHGRNETIPL